VAVDARGVLAGRTVTEIAAGGEHSCALAGGDIFCWGDNAYRQLGREGDGSPVPVAVDSSGLVFSAISAGEAHNCATSTGRAFCWGRTDFGALGRSGPFVTGELGPIDAPGASGSGWVTTASAGRAHACAVAGGAVYCWGANRYGKLGIGTTSASGVPVAVNSAAFSGKDVVSASAGSGHACAAAGGLGFCWGSNSHGRLGDAFVTDWPASALPIAAGLNAAQSFSMISAGGAHTCALAPGVPFCWGDNSSGQMGDGTRVSTAYAVRVRTGPFAGRPVTAVSAGAAHTCAVAGGKAFCWGDNAFGQLGTAGTSESTVPVEVGAALSTRTVAAVASGDGFSCAVADGDAYCWGDNAYGQLGDGTTRASAQPVRVGGGLAGRTVAQVSAGTSHACAVADGRAFCWGNGTFGRLGNGGTADSTVPVAVTGDFGGAATTSISAGSTHTCAVASTRAFCWGDNRDGALGDGSAANSTVPVAVTSGALAGRQVTSVSAGQGFTVAVAAATTARPATTAPPATTTPPPINTPKKVKRPGKIRITEKVVKRGKARVKWKKAKRATKYQVRITEPGRKYTKKYRKWTTQKKRVYVRKVRKGKKYRVQIRGVGPGGRGPIKTVKLRGR
jgi:alpha-tubulin suppressor-like RCC1 family protein